MSDARINTVERLLAQAERDVAQYTGELEFLRAEKKREADRYEFFQRTDWRGVYRYDRKLDGFLLVRSEGDTTEYPAQNDPMCDAGRVARMLRDDPYAATFLDPRLRDFAAWVIAVQRTKWVDVSP